VVVLLVSLSLPACVAPSFVFSSLLLRSSSGTGSGSTAAGGRPPAGVHHRCALARNYGAGWGPDIY
jgi:hypothetical protein